MSEIVRNSAASPLAYCWRSWLMWGFLAAVALCWNASALAETIPPPPKAYFNDAAGVVSSGVARELDAKLRQFESDTSNQVVVAIYPKMDSDSSIEDYTQRVAEKWRVGQVKRDNGAILFVFVNDRAMFLQVGYGLEGALPDALSKQIIDTEIIPQIRAGNWDQAMRAGVDAITKATRGEYTGTGRPIGRRQPGASPGWAMLLFIVILILSGIFRGRRGYGYGRHGYGPIWMGGLGSGGRGFGGGGGFGGFSGGGGSFGGGGAGGRW